jgi:diguanylate cyclase
MLSKAMKNQAIFYALCNGVVAFVLFAWLINNFSNELNVLGLATAGALSIGVLSWGTAQRLIERVSTSATAAVTRLTHATAGDLESPTPGEVGLALPALSKSLDQLFAQVRSNMENANSMALFDAVTALPNRVHFRNEAEAAIAVLPAKTRSALFFIDLDHFKSVNDSLGHAAGDQLLIMVANRLREVVSSITPASAKHNAALLPIPGRLAGDEFTLFLPEVRSIKVAEALAASLIAALNRPFTISGQQVEIGASIGVALRPAHGTQLTQLMRAADVAMYQAKDEGRGCSRFYSDDLAAQLAHREQLDKELSVALVRNEFGYVFQPQADLRTGQLVTAESLLRWYHPTDGMRYPRSFLGALEENGLIYAFSDWGIEAMADTAARWKAQGFECRLSTNFTHRELSRPNIADRIVKTLAARGAKATVCEFEISEYLAMNLSDAMSAELAKLRNAGATIAIDNFGRGEISLSKLRSIPFDRVKLDASVITDIADNASARAIAQGVISIIHGIGKEVVAQGVETPDQLQILKVMGCDAVQGFGIAKPMEESALKAWTWSNPVKQLRRAQ